MHLPSIVSFDQIYFDNYFLFSAWIMLDVVGILTEWGYMLSLNVNMNFMYFALYIVILYKMDHGLDYWQHLSSIVISTLSTDMRKFSFIYNLSTKIILSPKYRTNWCSKDYITKLVTLVCFMNWTYLKKEKEWDSEVYSIMYQKNKCAICI